MLSFTPTPAILYALALILPILAPSAAAQQPANNTVLSGPFQCAHNGKYMLCQNLWGASTGVGSQKSTLYNSLSSAERTAWSTEYTWSGTPGGVKSYANIMSTSPKDRGIQLATIISARTSWNWAYVSRSADLRANIAYDIWIGAPAAGDPATSAASYEIMIWLSSVGKIQPLGKIQGSGIQVGGRSWTLWKGTNKTWQVLSFVLDGGDVMNYNADLKDFFDYLVAKQGVPSTQHVQSVQAGTEPFTGSAKLMTTNYSVSIIRK
ncbi:endocellulase [Crassisporium funariophilum]|nr:endocellulase [Crassisporium funariophilum]